MAKEGKGTPIAICRKHWAAFILPGIVGLFVALGLLASISAMFTEGVAVGFSMFFGCLLVLAVLALYVFITYTSDCITLEESQIVGRIGFIHSRTLSTPLSKVQGISLSNGLRGKIFGYHTVTISNAGTDGPEYVFTKMAHAEVFVEKVNRQIESRDSK